jgi:hypothetical protein
MGADDDTDMVVASRTPDAAIPKQLPERRGKYGNKHGNDAFAFRRAHSGRQFAETFCKRGAALGAAAITHLRPRGRER